MTSQTELLACPFCGGAAHFDSDDDNWEWIECEGCGMQGNRSASLMEDCKPKLAEAWNRRATPATLERWLAPTSIDCNRPECMSLGCFGHCMKGITQEKRR